MMAAALLLAACGKDSGTTPAAAPQTPATTSCASKGELTMWERSGGNKQMVDMLVAAWNKKNPDCRIKQTYIPHTEMVGKIAQGIASGEVPELVRVAAPVHLKFTVRNAPGLYPSGEHLAGPAVASARERVRRAAIGVALLRRHYPDAVAST